MVRGSALAGLVARLRLVDDVDAALAANNLTVAVAQLQRAKRVSDLHGLSPVSRRLPPVVRDIPWKGMVGVTGIEPVTPSMSTKCSPAELYARNVKGVAITLWESGNAHVAPL